MRISAHLAMLLCVALIVPMLALQPATPATAQQQLNSELQEALNMINTWRSWLGISPLTVDPALQRAAEGHVNYYRLNFGDPSLAGMGLHSQTAGRPGFTGATMSERARNAGYSGSVNENAGISGSMVASTKWFIGTVGHRLTLIDPRYTHIGLAAVNQGGAKFEIINLGAPRWSNDAEVSVSAWPPHGTTGVGLSFSGEAPNPFPGARYPIGYPISLKFFGAGTVVINTATISTAGRQLPSFAEVGGGWLSRQTVLLCASAPLAQNTTYDVRITGTFNNQPFDHSWSFTTTNGRDDMALSGARAPQPLAPAPTPTVVPVRLPDGVGAAHELVQQAWIAADNAVAQNDVARSWVYGPDTWATVREEYSESVGNGRDVYYFDKARLEVDDRGGGDLRMTAGLLVRDMIAGRAQVGDNEFEYVGPAHVPLAGDPAIINPDAPTYASLYKHTAMLGGTIAQPEAGKTIDRVLQNDGAVSRGALAVPAATIGGYEPITGRNIATVFETYVRTLGTDWVNVVGLPISEPYWVRANVAGESTWVLVQAFERRLLTYTPDNDPAWRVEMGNVGIHYHTWRYGGTS